MCLNGSEAPREDQDDPGESQVRGTQGSLGPPWLSPGSPWSSLGTSPTLKQIRNYHIGNPGDLSFMNTKGRGQGGRGGHVEGLLTGLYEQASP